MKIPVEKLFSAVDAAWDQLLDFPKPQFLSGRGEGDIRNEFTAGAFLLLGWCGSTAVVLISALSWWIFNRAAGAVIFALLSWGVLTFKDSGRGDNALNRWLCEKLCGRYRFAEMEELLRVMPAVVKLFALIFIGWNGGFFYLTLVLTGAFGIQAALGLSADCTTEFFDRGEKAVKFFRTVLIVFLVYSFIFSRLGTLTAVLICIAVYALSLKRLKNSGFSGSSISLAGTAAEWSLLAGGLLCM